MPQEVTKVKKRDGRLVSFNQQKITRAIFKALTITGQGDEKTAKKFSDKVVKVINRRFKKEDIPDVEQIQDIIEEVIMMEDLVETAKAYILYREQRRRIREADEIYDEAIEIYDKYIGEIDWQVKENSNMAYSLQGLNNYGVSTLTKRYWLNKIYPKQIREGITSGDFHVHDLDFLGAYCCGWDLYDLLKRGFGGVLGKVESKPAKHLRAALGQVVNFFYTLQGEIAGAVAFSNFDTLLAPFIRYDNMDYPQVKQAMQEFLFNCAVPTRVGFQCLSEDTKILALDGWKSHNEVKQGDVIYTFNIQTASLEMKTVDTVFAREYEGMMYNLQNRSQDQLVSPNHRIVRQIFNAPKYTMEPIEEILKLKSPISIPVSSVNQSPDYPIDDNQLKLIAWTLSEGTIEKDGSHRVTIYQSPQAHPQNYREIIGLLDSFDFDYTKRMHSSLGTCCQIRLLPKSSKIIHQWIGGTAKKVPYFLYQLSQRQAKLFLETYVKGDGWTEKYRQRITVTDPEILEGLQAIAVLAGYNFAVLERHFSKGISKKTQHILTLTKAKHDYIQKIEKVDYKGVIWSVHTANETVIAKRNGQVFITGNTPFTNITIDINPSPSFAKQPVILGAELQKETYGEFQEEMNMLNKAFFEAMTEGDKNGRIFTFPIPTINITKDFPWDDPNLEPMWQATAKYGVNYFANFIQSDMNPEDVRSMCCRLRLNNKELYKRGGGLFGANPQTGSIGVVTVNLPRLGYLSKTKKEFFQRLERVMDLAKESLEIKRKAVEDFMRKGLYPYSKHYLEGVEKMRGSYYGNHFSTIGILGMNECLLNFMAEDMGSENGRKFALEVLDYMRERIVKYQEETDNLYNLEATPAEGTSYRLALKDKVKYPDIITAGTKEVPYYTNSSHLPVNYTDDIFRALEFQDELQCKYTGGCIQKGNKVLTNKGLFLIEDIVRNFRALEPLKALSYNTHKKTSEWDKIVKAVSVDVKKHDKIRIKGERNLDITTSDWHPFFVLKRFKPNPACPICETEMKNLKMFASHIRWNTECGDKYKEFPKYQVVEKRADELQTGDYILQNSANLYPDKTTELNNDLMWLIGFFVGDGCISKFIDNRGGNSLERYKVRFFSEYQEPLQKVADILRKYFNCEVNVIKNEKRSEALREVNTSKKEVAEFLFKYGFVPGKKCCNVSVSKIIKDNFTQLNVFSFLSGLIDSDGHIGKRYGDCEYYTVSPQLAEDILEICSIAGVMISKTLKPTKRKNEVDIWRLRIPQYEMIKMRDNFTNTVHLSRVGSVLSGRKKRHLPVVRVKEVSKAEVDDNQFYDLMTEKNHNYLAGKDCLVFVHNTVLHLFLGEQIRDTEAIKSLLKKVFGQFKLPYITLTPTFSICPTHGYLSGEHWACPKCAIEQKCEVYSRIVGYIRPVQQWHIGKAQEFKDRKVYKFE